MNSTRGFVHLGVFFLLLTTAANAYATDSSDFSERVARLQYLGGNVSVQPHGIGDWFQASVIPPLTNADNIWADKNSRAELNLGSGRMRIDSETSLTLTKVTDASVQVELHQGSLNVHVRRLKVGEIYEIDTPNVAFTVTKVGDYRINVLSDEDSTIVTVRQGEGRVKGHQTVVSVHAGEQIEFRCISLDHQVREAPRQDDFDKWCQVREQRLDQAVSARYALRIGSTDIDEYLTSRENMGYGLVWAPTTIVPGWGPYPNVYWFWINPWVSTWVHDPPED
jgi:ferric-dicitrate binding protein FerR (iron transport regulator)